MTEFHLSKADYEALTPAEIAFVMKAWEDKTVRDTTYIRDAVLNAIINGMRKKRQKFRKLWKKSGKMTADKKTDFRTKLKTIEEIEKKEKGWIDKVLAGAGIKRKAGEKKNEKKTKRE